MDEVVKLWINGGHVMGEGPSYELHNPYNQETLAVVSRASPAQMEAAVESAHQAFLTYRKLPAYKRAELLEKASRLIAERSERFARSIAQEVGKPIKTARIEVSRAVGTFHLAAEEATRLYGQVIPMDAVPAGEKRFGYYFRQPLGVVAGITPFNFPLNLVAHKVAPALGAGNAVIVRPTTQAPLTAYLLAEALADAGFPPGTVNAMPCSTEVAELLVQHPRVPVVTFTGSVPVGKRIRDLAGLKRVILELGSNSANVVTASADIAKAATATVAGGFSFAGQSCISVQRVYVQRSIWEEFTEAFVGRTQELKTGDPLDEATDVGPLIDESAAKRAESWIKEAVEGGARLLAGGERRGALLQPTVLSHGTPEMKVVCQEVFAPVKTLIPYDTFDEAVGLVNSSEYGLNAAIFTRDLQEAQRAMEEFEVGGIIINDNSAYRADQMPYGGVKQSGLGREGPRFAMEEMTEIKMVVFNLG